MQLYLTEKVCSMFFKNSPKRAPEVDYVRRLAVLMSMALFAFTNNLTTEHIECSKQSAGPVSLVVMCHCPCTNTSFGRA